MKPKQRVPQLPVQREIITKFVKMVVQLPVLYQRTIVAVAVPLVSRVITVKIVPLDLLVAIVVRPLQDM
jgi:hypothetical protein